MDSDFYDWLAACYRSGEILEDEIKRAIEDGYLADSLFEDFVDCWTNHDRINLVQDACKRLLKNKGKLTKNV